MDVSGPPSSIKNGSKRFYDKVEEEGGKGVALANPPTISEEITHFPINGDGSLAPRNQTQSSVNPPWFKAYLEEDLSQEGPIDPIVGFSKSSFRKTPLSFLVLVSCTISCRDTTPS